MKLTKRKFLRYSALALLFGLFFLILPLFSPVSPRKARSSEDEYLYEYIYPLLYFSEWLNKVKLTSGPETTHVKIEVRKGDDASSEEYPLNPHASLEMILNGIDGQPDGVNVYTTKPLLAGRETFTGKDGGHRGNMASLLLDGEAYNTMYLAHIASNSQWKTRIALRNPTPLDANVELELIGSSGTQLGYKELTVPALSQVYDYAENLFGKANLAGYVKVDNSQPISC